MGVINAKMSGGNTQHNSTYELFVGVLAVFSLLVMAIIFILPQKSSTRDIWLAIDIIICFFFMFDFFRSLILAPDRKTYLKWGWLDVLGSIPGLPILRLARLARITRVAYVIHTTDTHEIWHQFRSRPAESTLAMTALIAVIVVTFSSVAVLRLESRSPEANILNGHDAIWWSFVTITTVGYGDYFPVTHSGRIIAAILMTIGVGIFGVLTSYLSIRFLTSGYSKWETESETEGAGNASKDDIATLRGDIAALQTRLDTLEQLLREHHQLHQKTK